MHASVISDNTDFAKNDELIYKVLKTLEGNLGISSLEIVSKDIIRELNPEDVEVFKDWLRKIKIIETYNFKRTEFWNTFFDLLWKHPIGAFLYIKRKLLECRAFPNRECDVDVMEEIFNLLENSLFIARSKSMLNGLKIEDKTIYYRIFNPYDRMFLFNTKFFISYSGLWEVIKNYKLKDGTEVKIIKDKEGNYLYYVVPTEFLLSREEIDVIKLIIDSIYSNEKLFRNENIRRVVEEYVKDMLVRKGFKGNDLDRLEVIIIRNTVGLGFIEMLILDRSLEDIYVNPQNNLVFVKHRKYGYLATNIYADGKEMENFSSKLRMYSGRPLDESNPVLDTSLEVMGVDTRISVAIPPFSYRGIAFSVRRHREEPLTLLNLVNDGFLSVEAAAFLKIVAESKAALLIGGSRGSGKTTLLSSLLFEIPKTTRIVVIEDTKELPIEELETLGFNVLGLKVRGSLSFSHHEISAEDGVKASLRFGDSALIIGEVRGKEAKALYEAMRIGALSSLVAGTIHGESPYGVFDRVVNDLEVPVASFKATDFIVMAGNIKKPYNPLPQRRILSIVGVGKYWHDDPLKENAFYELFTYDPLNDKLIMNKDIFEFENVEKLYKDMGISKREFIEILNYYKEIINYMVSRGRHDPSFMHPKSVINANIVAKNVLIEYGETSFDWKEGFEKWKLRFPG